MHSATLDLDAPADPPATSWAALDEPGEWRAFSRPVPGEEGAWESWIAIEGMYCPGCSLTVEDALAGSAGVRSVQVNGATATARVVWAPAEGRPSAWFAAITSAAGAALS